MSSRTTSQAREVGEKSISDEAQVENGYKEAGSRLRRLLCMHYD